MNDDQHAEQLLRKCSRAISKEREEALGKLQENMQFRGKASRWVKDRRDLKCDIHIGLTWASEDELASGPAGLPLSNRKVHLATAKELAARCRSRLGLQLSRVSAQSMALSEVRPSPPRIETPVTLVCLVDAERLAGLTCERLKKLDRRSNVLLCELLAKMQ